MSQRLPCFRRRSRALAVLPAAVLGLWTLPLGAQNASGGGVGGPSLASDSVPLSRTISDHEQVQNEMGRARMRLGPIRILPSFHVFNAGYDSNVFAVSEEDDPTAAWTATVNAGAIFLVPFGSKIVLRARAFPQYTWYQDLPGRNQFGGQYTGSLFGFFNRMSVELRSAYFQQYQQYSSEIETFVFQRTTGVTAKVEVDLTSRLALFGQGAYSDTNFEQIDGPPVQEVGVRLNDRTATGGRGGLRYEVSPAFNVGVVAEGTFADFEFEKELRNNQSNAYLASVGFNRPRLYLNLLGGYREGTGDTTDTLFPRYTTGVGSFFLSYFPISWLELQAFGHRDVSYSINVENPYYFENRIGGKVNIQLGPRILVSGFGLVGPNNYPLAQPVIVDGQIKLVKRRDEYEQYGGGVSVIVYRPLVFTGRVIRNTSTSNIPGQGRDYTRFTAMLSFGGTFER
jgi:hypothetical protein